MACAQRIIHTQFLLFLLEQTSTKASVGDCTTFSISAVQEDRVKNKLEQGWFKECIFEGADRNIKGASNVHIMLHYICCCCLC